LVATTGSVELLEIDRLRVTWVGKATRSGAEPERTRGTRRQTRYDQAELISLPSTLPLLRTVQKELIQPTASKVMRLVIDKQPEGTRSPYLADAVVMAVFIKPFES
jgi:hypothetical protein